MPLEVEITLTDGRKVKVTGLLAHKATHGQMAEVVKFVEDEMRRKDETK